MNFLREGLNVIAGSALGGLAFVIENTITALLVTAGAMTAAQSTFYGGIVFILVLAGCVLSDIGGKMGESRGLVAKETSA